jgi:predicted Rossmann-fold nucleotide-binding protein
MASVSKAFYESGDRLGSVIGIIPCQENSVHPKPGYPNPWIEIPIFTHLSLSGTHGAEPLSRNHINILTSDIIVALPGGTGTASEAALAVAYHRPIIAFLASSEEIPGLPGQVPVQSDFGEICIFVSRALADQKLP